MLITTQRTTNPASDHTYLARWKRTGQLCLVSEHVGIIMLEAAPPGDGPQIQIGDGWPAWLPTVNDVIDEMEPVVELVTFNQVLVKENK